MILVMRMMNRIEVDREYEGKGNTQLCCKLKNTQHITRKHRTFDSLNNRADDVNPILVNFTTTVCAMKCEKEALVNT